MNEGRQQLIKFLHQANAQELALVSTLSAHIGMAEPGSYRRLLQQHLRETRTHAELVQRRLNDLGATQRRGLLQSAAGVVKTIVGQGIVAAKGPMDMLRGMSVQEKMLWNARDEAMTEAMEITTYEAIEHLAVSIGDLETAELAARIRAEEEAMLASLREEVPNLTAGVVNTKIPLGERTVATLDEPWPGYDDQTVDEIQKRLSGAPETVRARVREYEREHKNRKTVIEASEKEAATA